MGLIQIGQVSPLVLDSLCSALDLRGSTPTGLISTALSVFIIHPAKKSFLSKDQYPLPLLALSTPAGRNVIEQIFRCSLS